MEKLVMIKKNEEVRGGGSKDAENGIKKETNVNKNSDKVYEFGSDGEYEVRWGSGSAEGDSCNDYDQSENENCNIEFLILEAFET